MARILVLGATGMLGHKLVQTLAPCHEVYGAIRGPSSRITKWPGVFTGTRIIDGMSVETDAAIQLVLDRSCADVVVNCIGIVKQLPEASDPVVATSINALLPHRLHQLVAKRGCRLIHVSTDCVFNGSRGQYKESDAPDATDLYGRSKALGEPISADCLTVRTSMIGRELFGHRGLIDWFLSNRGGTVPGYRRAIFSGLTTLSLSRILGGIISCHPKLAGLYHVAADPIDKYALLSSIQQSASLPIRVVSEEDPACDRSLDGSLFEQATGIRAPGWGSMIEELVTDSKQYET